LPTFSKGTTVIARLSGTGYAANGNGLNATDSVTGTWAYGYDYLNRLASATGSAGTFNGTVGVSGVTIDWQYDSFGNRTFQTASTVNLPSEWAQYTPASNRLVSTNLAIGSMQYDAAGDVLFDGINSYAYDAEGRVCAVGNGSAYTGYVYDAEGNRAAKGSVNGLNCNLSTNGFSLTKSYIRGTGGELLTEMGAGGQWVYSDAYADGQLRATYNVDGNTYFALNDWLGTKRAELSAAGCLETFGSLPFGDDLTPLGNCPDATEQHFTGKERDTESGLDYFGARYYASNMGRWISPDWSKSPEAVPYASLRDPQSLNLYSYVSNNPLKQRDPDGHHQECGAQTSSTDPTTGAVTVNANCHDVPDWWQFQGVRHFLGRHKTATKVVMNAVVIPATVVSGLADGGTSELLVPEEIALEEAILEGGTAVEETAAEAAAEDAAETAAQPASEKQALRVAKQIEKDLGKDARRDFHDEKLKGAGDRTMQQLKDDARAIYEDHGKTPPSWLK
jgi:RHS repeat-associated protein